MSIEIVRAIIEGTHLAVYSSIKPGGVHRLRLDIEAHALMSSCISVLDYIVKAIELGESVKKGNLAATSINLGNLYARALREAYRWLGRNVRSDVIVPSITNALILSYTEPESVIEEAGNLRKALNIFINGTKWRDVREFINALRSVGEEEKVTHLQDTGITYSQALAEGVNLGEAFNSLSSKWPGFIAVNPRETLVFDMVKKLMEYYRYYKEPNNAIIRLYIDLISPRIPSWAKELFDKAIENKLMATKEGGKLLFEIDLKLRKSGYIYDNYIPLLIAITQLAVYEGLRPTY